MVVPQLKPAPFPQKYQFWNINSLYIELTRHNGFKSLCETLWGFLHPFLRFVFGEMLKMGDYGMWWEGTGERTGK